MLEKPITSHAYPDQLTLSLAQVKNKFLYLQGRKKENVTKISRNAVEKSGSTTLWRLFDRPHNFVA